jgi:hypothetical protein
MEEETQLSEEGNQYLVVHIGNLEDCKYALGILHEAEIACRMDVAENFRPELAQRGYYIVIVKSSLASQARAAIEARLQQDLDINLQAVGGEGDEKCPACGAALPVDCTTCPECGLCFE